MKSKAPVLNQAAIKAPTTPGPVPGPKSPDEREQAERERVRCERVAVAVEFGAALEDLVAYTYLVAYAQLQEDEPDAASRISGLRFPPDLLVRLTPKAHLQRTRQKLLKLEPTLLGLEQLDGTAPPAKPPPPSVKPPPPSVKPSPPPVGSSPPHKGPGGTQPPPPQPPPLKPDGAQHPGSEGTTAGATVPPPTPNETQQPAPGGAKMPGGTAPPAKSEETQQLGPEGTTPGAPTPGEAMPPPPWQPNPGKTQPQGLKGTTPLLAPNGTQQPGSNVMGPGGTHQQRQQPIPSREFKIEQRTGILLPARCAQGDSDSQDREYPLTSLNGLYEAICLWNERIVELLMDSPVVLGGFRVGKALSLTQWQIRRVDERWNRADGGSFADPWDEVFGKQRIDEIQRHLGTLSTVLDSRAVTAVSTSLEYWRNALLYLTPLEASASARSRWRNALQRLASIGEPSGARSRSPQPSSYEERAIEISRGDREKLLPALEEQIDNWLDLLTGRRPPESFPVAGIVTSLTKKVTANLWARFFRFLVPVLLILVIVAALLAAGFLVLNAFDVLDVFDSLKGHGTTLLGGLGSLVVAVLTALVAPRGQSLSGRGATNAAAGGGINGGSHSGFVPRGSHGAAGALAGAAVGAAANLKQDVLSDVVEQLRLEELNLAVSDPLVRCVLALEGQEKGDPAKDAERFLRLVYKDGSNLKRLQPVFKDLYKD